MSAISPTPEAIQALLTNPEKGPVVMLNLLKFKPAGGQEEYAKYAAAVAPMLAKVGGRILYAGRVDELLVADRSWDAIAIVEYPSRQKFFEMVSNPEYQKIHEYRERGLDHAALIATTPQMIGGAR